MQVRIGKLETLVAQQITKQELNHAQNRKDIHDLRNMQQKIVDALSQGLERVIDKIESKLETELKPIKRDVLNLKLWRSKTTGYALGLAGASALVFEIVSRVADKVLK